jgi:hypothetical protein
VVAGDPGVTGAAVIGAVVGLADAPPPHAAMSAATTTASPRDLPMHLPRTAG